MVVVYTYLYLRYYSATPPSACYMRVHKTNLPRFPIFKGYKNGEQMIKFSESAFRYLSFNVCCLSRVLQDLMNFFKLLLNNSYNFNL